MKKYNVKIKVAYDINNNFIMIEDALYKNKYFCIDCKKELIVKKGEKIKHHYAHKNKSECTGESWQHKYSKLKIIQNINNIKFKFFCKKC